MAADGGSPVGPDRRLWCVAPVVGGVGRLRGIGHDTITQELGGSIAELEEPQRRDGRRPGSRGPAFGGRIGQRVG